VTDLRSGVRIVRAAGHAIGGDCRALFASNRGRPAAASAADYLPGHGRWKVGSGSLPPSVGDRSSFVSITSDHLCPPNLIKIKQSKNAIISNKFNRLWAIACGRINPIFQMISIIRAR
jgi:hypothetical protein